MFKASPSDINHTKVKFDLVAAPAPGSLPRSSLTLPGGPHLDHIEKEAKIERGMASHAVRKVQQGTGRSSAVDPTVRGVDVQGVAAELSSAPSDMILP